MRLLLYFSFISFFIAVSCKAHKAQNVPDTANTDIVESPPESTTSDQTSTSTEIRVFSVNKEPGKVSSEQDQVVEAIKNSGQSKGFAVKVETVTNTEDIPSRMANGETAFVVRPKQPNQMPTSNSTNVESKASSSGQANTNKNSGQSKGFAVRVETVTNTEDIPSRMANGETAFVVRPKQPNQMPTSNSTNVESKASSSGQANTNAVPTGDVGPNSDIAIGVGVAASFSVVGIGLLFGKYFSRTKSPSSRHSSNLSRSSNHSTSSQLPHSSSNEPSKPRVGKDGFELKHEGSFAESDVYFATKHSPSHSIQASYSKLNTESLAEFNIKIQSSLKSGQMDDPFRNQWRRNAYNLSRKYMPIELVRIGERDFYLSKVITREKDRYNYAVLYTEDPLDPSRMFARLAYRSNSDGGWRVAPYVAKFRVATRFGAEFKTSFSKGADVHYTQETKPPVLISQRLEEFRQDPSASQKVENDIQDEFAIDVTDKTRKNMVDKIFADEVRASTLSKEVSKALKPLQDCKPGECFADSMSDMNVVELINEINNALTSLKGFVPVFSQQPKIAYAFDHTLLGKTEVEVFEGVLDSRPVEWHMAQDSKGRIWIERISYPDSPVSSYGVSSEFLDSGVLTNKPLEYRVQAAKLFDVEFSDKQKGAVLVGDDFRYVDITGFLDQLSPIAAYRQAKKIKKSVE